MRSGNHLGENKQNPIQPPHPGLSFSLHQVYLFGYRKVSVRRGIHTRNSQPSAWQELPLHRSVCVSERCAILSEVGARRIWTWGGDESRTAAHTGARASALMPGAIKTCIGRSGGGGGGTSRPTDSGIAQAFCRFGGWSGLCFILLFSKYFFDVLKCLNWIPPVEPFQINVWL